jgi:uncharacterized membrane protein YeiH
MNRVELPVHIAASTLALVLDRCGTFVFALSGAAAGIRHRFDVFGVLVLSFAAANVGGILRDLLIGAVPPPLSSDWRYVAVPVLAGLATFRWGAIIDRVRGDVHAVAALAGAAVVLGRIVHLPGTAATLAGGALLRDSLRGGPARLAAPGRGAARSIVASARRGMMTATVAR